MMNSKNVIGKVSIIEGNFPEVCDLGVCERIILDENSKLVKRIGGDEKKDTIKRPPRLEDLIWDLSKFGRNIFRDAILDKRLFMSKFYGDHCDIKLQLDYNDKYNTYFIDGHLNIKECKNYNKKHFLNLRKRMIFRYNLIPLMSYITKTLKYNKIFAELMNDRIGLGNERVIYRFGESFWYTTNEYNFKGILTEESLLVQKEFIFGSKVLGLIHLILEDLFNPAVIVSDYLSFDIKRKKPKVKKSYLVEKYKDNFATERCKNAMDIAIGKANEGFMLLDSEDRIDA